MSKVVTKLTKCLGQLEAGVASQSRNVLRRNGRRRTRRRRATGARWDGRRSSRGILAGYGSPVTASFSQSRIADGEIVNGMDLVTSPLQVGDCATNISFFITANPASWNGTRIAAIASGYQNYRPLKFIVHYRPQVGSTSTLSMFIGTVWQNTYITNRSALEPSLVTSPGGTYLPAWQSSRSVVPLGRRLPQRMFPIRDPHFTTVPFSVVCRASDGGPTSPSVPMPGRIFIEYAYEFHNAIGSGEGFAPSVVDQVALLSGNIYPPGDSSAIAAKPAWVVNGAGTSRDRSTGWLIDMNAAPSVQFPLFSHMTTDFLMAAFTQDETVPQNAQAIEMVKINGSQPVPPDTPSSLSVSLYDDNGAPE